jgi:glycosyltransferase involved in cell wall biosynthesis
MLHGYDVVVLSPSEWSDNAVSNMQISAILSEQNNVVYVETIGGRLPRLSEFKRVIARLRRILSGVSEGKSTRGLDPRNVKIFSPFAIPVHGNKVVDWFNRIILLYQIRKVIKQLKMNKPIVWSFSPRWFHIGRNIESICNVFHCVDALQTYDVSSKFRELYIKSVENADLVFTPGVLLEKELMKINKNTIRIGHGCGTEHLEPSGTTTATIEKYPSPLVVYAGTLANWVDYDLLIAVADKLRDVNFLLIGYVHALAPAEQVNKLASFPNVYMPGYKNYSILHHYYKQADVAIVPYQANNEHIKYSTPTKFLDYFASGLSVVSTRFPAAENLSDMVSVADSPDEFANAILQGIKEDTGTQRELRLEYAKNHTWEKQVEKMSEHIMKVINKN